jgi:hypothetical protein
MPPEKKIFSSDAKSKFIIILESIILMRLLKYQMNRYVTDNLIITFYCTLDYTS